MQRNLETFNNIHKNQMCFIIASGPSVSLIDLSLIKNYISISVNSGYCGFPECDYFVSDDESVANWSFFVNDLSKSKTTLFLYEDKLKKFECLFQNRVVFYRHRVGYHVSDKYEHENYSNRICQSRTSVGTAIAIAHVMGCSPIILAGVDCIRLNNRRYFWQDQKKKPYRNDNVLPDHFYKTIFNSNVMDTDLVEIYNYWINQADFGKLEIYNVSSISILDIFPKLTLTEVIKKFGERSKNVG